MFRGPSLDLRSKAFITSPATCRPVAISSPPEVNQATTGIGWSEVENPGGGRRFAGCSLSQKRVKVKTEGCDEPYKYLVSDEQILKRTWYGVAFRASPDGYLGLRMEIEE